MTKSIVSSATFSVSPQRLYEIYMNSKLHSAAIGAPAKIDPKVGGKFSAWGGELSGKTLHLVPGKMIVQTWRGRHWQKSDPDSILVLRFSGNAKAGRIDLVHEGVPAHDQKGVSGGWVSFYWKPWKAYLSKVAGKK